MLCAKCQLVDAKHCSLFPSLSLCLFATDADAIEIYCSRASESGFVVLFQLKKDFVKMFSVSFRFVFLLCKAKHERSKLRVGGMIKCEMSKQAMNAHPPHSQWGDTCYTVYYSVWRDNHWENQ